MFVAWVLNSKENEKCIVHCSAGIGRTGVLLAISELMIEINSSKNKGDKNPKFSIFNTVRKLKEQRFGMVQTFVQYQFIYHFLLDKFCVNNN